MDCTFPKDLKILIASSEFWPFSKTGGLADMVAALAKYLSKFGHHVTVLTPFYRSVAAHPMLPILAPYREKMVIPFGSSSVMCDILQAPLEERLWLMVVKKPEFYDRDGLYDEKVDNQRRPYHDNFERFLLLSKCAFYLSRHAIPPFDIIHLHDWHVAATALFVKHSYWYDGWYDAPKTLLTIHNLEYQGRFPSMKYELLNLPPYYFHYEAAEFYGSLNMLKIGIVFSDVITTVSPTYAREILTPQFGWGLEEVLKKRQYALFGILNGVDYEVWNTKNNPHLYAQYGPDNLEGKLVNKLKLQELLSLPVHQDIPLFGTISRLEYQKGIDLILEAFQRLKDLNWQYILLGSGDPTIANSAKILSQRLKEKFVFREGYDEKLAHLIEAGADFYVMPSRFEPCGLNQLYALRYGTIPIVHATGGLADTIIDERENPDAATGIKFYKPSVEDLVEAIHRALNLYQNAHKLFQFRQRGMKADFSWYQTVTEYVRLYAKLLRRR